jgi:hydroxymethylpyrimidine pyrophosphatase-like HAD family hydrolase
VKDILESADMVVFSSGTWWASQIPTLMTQGMREILDNLKCPKVLVMNNEPDKDMIGIDNVEMLSVISDYMNLDDVDVLINGEASASMRHDCVKASHSLMGNDHGKHDPDRLAFEVLSFYYSRFVHNIFYFDFDDTIWSRDKSLKEKSIENVKLLNKFSKKQKVVLVSGHAYKTIHSKLSEIYGRNLDPIEFDIWADGGIVKYQNNQIVHFDKKYVVKGVNWIKGYAKTLGFDDEIDFRPNQFTPTCISFHGIDDRYRPLMKAFLEQLSMTHQLNNKVEIVGTTSVEIFHCATNKAIVFENYRHKYLRSYYVGDEIDSGNDKEIAEMCTKAIRVRDIRDTNILLKYLLEYYNESPYESKQK